MKPKKMEKLVAEVIEKLEKLKKSELAAELTWCWGSYQHDQISSGVVEKASLALEAFKQARDKNSKAVSKKLIEDLEKALELG